MAGIIKYRDTDGNFKDLPAIRGAPGKDGQPGEKGDTGATPDFSIGTVRTVSPDTPAAASITGTAENPVLNFDIPQGQPGQGGGGTADHNALTNRSAPDQHPMSAITGLYDALREKGDGLYSVYFAPNIKPDQEYGESNLYYLDEDGNGVILPIMDMATDDTLTKEGRAADAKQVGTELRQLEEVVAEKQDAISDLQSIRNGAGKGATALQPSAIADWAKQPNKPSYTASEVGALPSGALNGYAKEQWVEGKGYLTTETDPTVPAWAKQPNKPSYTASEVGALPSSYTPPPAPVQSVNGKTGNVALAASDVGAISTPDTWNFTAEQQAIAQRKIGILSVEGVSF